MELLDYEREHLAVLRDSLAECTVLLKSDGSFPIETAGSSLCTAAAQGRRSREAPDRAR